jgi:hypothetical protein
MKSRSLRSLLLGCSLTVLTPLAPAAQPIDKGPPADSRKAIGDAKALIKGNDLVAAEKKLTDANLSAPDTAAWSLETSTRLLQVAGELAREGTSKDKIPAVVVRTLQHLDTSPATALGKGDGRSQAQAKALAGFIHERYRGDLPSAIASYRAAAKLDPDDPAIRESLDRLERIEANLNAKISGKR